MEEVVWKVTQPNGKVEVTGPGRGKLHFVPPLEITEKTPKSQYYSIETWNMMRTRLIELGEMESK